MRNFVGMALCALTLAVSNAGAQDAAALRSVDEACNAAAAAIAKTLAGTGSGGGPRVSVGSFFLDGADSPFGRLWSQNLTASLADTASRNFIVAAPTGTGTSDVVVQGEIHELGDTLRVFTLVFRRADSVLLLSDRRDLDARSFSTLLATDSSGGSVRRDALETDSREAPVPLAPGGAGLDRTIHWGDEDWFALEAPSEGLLVVETFGDLDTVLTAYGADGRIELGEDDDSGSGGNAKLEFLAAAGARYLIRVSAFDDETGRYGISAATEPLSSLRADNRTRASAADLAQEDRQRGLLGRADESWYRFSVPSEGAVALVYTSGTAHTYLALYDGQGKLIAEGDDSDDDWDGNAWISRNLDGGTYYVRVTVRDGVAGVFSVSLELGPAGVEDDFEYDGDRDSAVAFDLDESPQRHSFTDGNDEDWVYFDVPQRDYYLLGTHSADSDNDPSLELYDDEGELIAENDDEEESLDAQLRIRLRPGRYFLRVYNLNDGQPADAGYDLTIERD